MPPNLGPSLFCGPLCHTAGPTVTAALDGALWPGALCASAVECGRQLQWSVPCWCWVFTSLLSLQTAASPWMWSSSWTAPPALQLLTLTK